MNFWIISLESATDRLLGTTNDQMRLLDAMSNTFHC